MNRKILIAIIVIVAVIIVVAGYFLQKTSLTEEQVQSKILSDVDIRAKLENLEKINAYPDNKNINPDDYPKVLGKYSKNELILIEIYFCSDVCPDAGEVLIVFENIRSKEKCAEVGGKDLIDPAWKGYIGCAPDIAEETSKQYLYNSVEECAVVKYTCNEGEKSFSDELGCGCETVE